MFCGCSGDGSHGDGVVGVLTMHAGVVCVTSPHPFYPQVRGTNLDKKGGNWSSTRL